MINININNNATTISITNNYICPKETHNEERKPFSTLLRFAIFLIEIGLLIFN